MTKENKSAGYIIFAFETSAHSIVLVSTSPKNSSFRKIPFQFLGVEFQFLTDLQIYDIFLRVAESRSGASTKFAFLLLRYFVLAITKNVDS